MPWSTLYGPAWAHFSTKSRFIAKWRENQMDVVQLCSAYVSRKYPYLPQMLFLSITYCIVLGNSRVVGNKFQNTGNTNSLFRPNSWLLIFNIWMCKINVNVRFHRWCYNLLILCIRVCVF